MAKVMPATTGTPWNGEATMNLLTRKRVEALCTRPGRYGDGAGLYLEVFSPNSASWFLRYRRSGIERWLGLGPLHTFGLVEARDRARKARVLLADGD